MRWFDVSKNNIKLHLKKSQRLIKKLWKTCWTPGWLRAINHELSQVKTFACMRGGWRNPRRFWNENTVQFVSSPTSINRHHVHRFHGNSLNSMRMDTEYLMKQRGLQSRPHLQCSSGALWSPMQAGQVQVVPVEVSWSPHRDRMCDRDWSTSLAQIQMFNCFL